MAYDNHEANVIKSALEHGIGEGIGDDTYGERLRRDALTALERLVQDWLPEGADARKMRLINRIRSDTPRRERNPHG